MNNKIKYPLSVILLLIGILIFTQPTALNPFLYISKTVNYASWLRTHCFGIHGIITHPVYTLGLVLFSFIIGPVIFMLGFDLFKPSKKIVIDDDSIEVIMPDTTIFKEPTNSTITGISLDKEKQQIILNLQSN